MAFIDQGEFEAMKTPISHRAPRCDKNQFCAKNDGECFSHLRDIVVEHSGRNKKNEKNGTFANAHFCV